MKHLLIITIAAVAAFGQANINPRQIVVTADAQTAFAAYAVTEIVDAPARLSLDINPTITTVRVEIGAVYAVGDVIKIDSECMTITAKTGRDLTVTRASLGTTAANHGRQMPVEILRYPTLQEFARAKAIDAIRELVAKYMPDIDAQQAALAASKATRLAASVQ